MLDTMRRAVNIWGIAIKPGVMSTRAIRRLRPRRSGSIPITPCLQQANTNRGKAYQARGDLDRAMRLLQAIPAHSKLLPAASTQLC